MIELYNTTKELSNARVFCSHTLKLMRMGHRILLSPPFFCGFDGLTVDDGSAGLYVTPIFFSEVKGAAGMGIFLAKPAFAQEAGMSFLEQEAGIAAYTNLGQKINLTKAKTAFRTV